MNNEDIKNLKRICESCKRIQILIDRFGDDYDIFFHDFAYQDSVTTQISQIGEHVKRLSDEFKENESHINWKGWAGVRNICVHLYHHIDYQTIWNIIHKDILLIKQICEKYIKQILI